MSSRCWINASMAGVVLAPIANAAILSASTVGAEEVTTLTPEALNEIAQV